MKIPPDASDEWFAEHADDICAYFDFAELTGDEWARSEVEFNNAFHAEDATDWTRHAALGDALAAGASWERIARVMFLTVDEAQAWYAARCGVRPRGE